MQFKRETLQATFQEAVPLVIEHWHEVTPFRHMTLEPDIGEYLTLESSGMLRVFTARDHNGVLHGYAVFVVRTNRHYKSKIFAYQDALYVCPDVRGFGHTFMKWCDEQLKLEGVNVVFQYVTGRYDFSTLLRRQGYRQLEQVWAKQLNEV